MKTSTKFKQYLGLFLLTLILLVNLYIAAGYYHISSMKLMPFYIWQTNIDK
ncbi:MAG: hypothetical protein JWQ66_1825 [Mucilaginibacter sp.]|nr:hypothetical protein [Mucilaginibacter sp.]